MLKDERALATTCLTNVATVQEGMGDKPTQAQNTTNYLNSKSKDQLLFVVIQDRADLIVQARKYIVKDNLAKVVAVKENLLLRRIEDFKIISKDIFSQGLPNFWDEKGVCISESDYHLKLQEKRNDITPIDKMDLIIKGQDIFEILDKYFFLFHEIRQLILGLPPPSYNFYS